MRRLLYIIILLGAVVPFATYATGGQPPTTLFSGLFNVPANDLSMSFIDTIFGDVVSGSNKSALMPLIGILNSTIIILGLAIILYYIFYYTITAAMTGNFIADSTSPFLVVRVILGLLLLITMPSGYTYSQYLVYHIIKGGVGFADLVWTQALERVVPATITSKDISSETSGNETASKYIYSNISTPIQQVWDGVTCTLRVNQSKDGGNYNSQYDPIFKQENKTPPQLSSLATMISDQGNKLTGELRRIQNEQLKYYVHGWQRPYISKVDVDGKAKLCFGIPDDATGCQYSTSDNDNILRQKADVAKCGDVVIDGTNKEAYMGLTTGFLAAAAIAVERGDDLTTPEQSKVASMIENTIQKFIQDVTMTQTGSESGQRKSVTYGWITAGLYYAAPIFGKETTSIKYDHIFSDFKLPSTTVPTSYYGYATLYNYGKQRYTNTLRQASGCSVNDPGMKVLQELQPKKHPPAGAGGQLVQGIYSMYEDVDAVGALTCQDPIATKALVGQGLMEKAMILLIAILTGQFILSLTSVLGATIPWVPMVDMLIFWTTSILLIIITVVMVQGVLLGIVLPLIPAIAFIGGAICWLLAAIEAMVAAPIVALGIMWPGSGHVVLGKAEPVLHLLLQLLLRPALMIAGLILGMLICWLGFYLVDMAFSIALDINLIRMDDMTGLLLISTIKVYMAIAIARKAFSLIYDLPDKVFNWIGAQVQAYGQLDEFMMPLQEGAEAGATEFTSIGRQLTGSMKKSMGERRDKAKKGK